MQISNRQEMCEFSYGSECVVMFCTTISGLRLGVGQIIWAVYRSYVTLCNYCPTLSHKLFVLSLHYHILSSVIQGYVPTKQDILHARKATKGIVEYDTLIQKIPFKFVDVGGQRSQRTKWFQCFDSVTAILFLVSSSEYDQVLMEDRQTNRLVESVRIFETIVKNKNFLNVAIILFLNKTDLLEEKVSKVSIADYFPDEFEGEPHDLFTVQKFILGMFDEKCHQSDRTKPLFHHFTTAIDTENIRFVFQAAKDTILQDNLRSIMMQ